MPRFVIVKNGIARIMDALPGIDPADAIAKWHPDDQAEVTSHRAIDISDIPSHPQFKDAWRDNGTSIDVDMPAARTIHIARINTAVAKQNLEDAQNHSVAEIANDTAAAAQLAGAINSRKGRETARNVLIANASNPTALDAIWDSDTPRN